MSKQLPDLIASYFTIAGKAEMEMVGGTEISPHTPRDRIEMAARGGFRGIGFGDKDLRRWQRSYPTSEIRRMLADNGIEHLEIDAVYDWYSPRDRVANDAVIDEVYGWAAELGARQVKAVTSFTGEQFPHDHLVERWARLCETAREAGTRAVLEPMPPATLKRPEEALAVLRDAGAANGGLLIDIWHVDRAGVDYESLREIPAEWIGGVEIGDAAKEPVNGDLFDDGFNHRQLPGQGELDVVAFTRAILATGYSGPFGTEVFSIENRARTLAQAVSDNYEAAVAVLNVAVNA